MMSSRQEWLLLGVMFCGCLGLMGLAALLTATGWPGWKQMLCIGLSGVVMGVLLWGMGKWLTRK